MRHVVIVVCTAALAACGMAGNSSSAGKAEATAVVESAVRAVCGPGSRPELGIQGRVAVEEVESGRSLEGYTCNLEPISREGDGAEWQMAWYDDCAYYGLGAFFAMGSTTGFVPGAPAAPAGGTAVVDVSDPEKPVRVLTLNTPAMIDPWESLKVNERRGLLAGSSVSIEGPAFDLYDVKPGLVAGVTDCAHPRLMFSGLNGGLGHEGEWSPDGNTYWSSGFLSPFTTAIDVSLPEAPHPYATISDGIHGLSVSDDGNRLYAAEFTRAGLGVGEAEREAPAEGEGTNGLEIWDVSAIQSRAVSATTAAMPTPLVGAVYWTDGGAAQMTIPVTIQGKPYVVFIDEGGEGMARIIDISDEKHPVVVSKLKDEIDLPENTEIRVDVDKGSDGAFNYQGHYCGVPQRVEPGIVACSYFWQGIRVFDIRDPVHPKEIAYFIPPLDAGDDGRAHTSSAIRFIPERAEMWFTNQNTGFHVVRFTNGVWPFKN